MHAQPVPALSGVYGPVLEPEEKAFVHVDVEYARLYGGDGSYTRTSLVAFGSPAFMVGAIAGNAIANGARRRAAQAATMVTWREAQISSAIATDRRLLCHVHPPGWLSFWYSGVTEFYPDLDHWTVTMAFGDTSPLRLAGPAAPVLAVLAANAITPNRWAADPRFARLTRGHTGDFPR